MKRQGRTQPVAPESETARLLTVKEAAAEMKCSISFVYKLMLRRELAFECRGRRRLPLADSVAEYRNRSRVPATPSRLVSDGVLPQRRYKHLFN